MPIGLGLGGHLITKIQNLRLALPPLGFQEEPWRPASSQASFAGWPTITQSPGSLGNPPTQLSPPQPEEPTSQI